MEQTEIVEITKLVQNEQAKTLLVCERVAYLLRLRFGFSRVYGRYCGPEVQDFPQPYTHWWNTTSDGTIVDATANQFGDAHPVRIVRTEDLRHAWYIGKTRY